MNVLFYCYIFIRFYFILFIVDFSYFHSFSYTYFMHNLSLFYLYLSLFCYYKEKRGNGHVTSFYKIFIRIEFSICID